MALSHLLDTTPPRRFTAAARTGLEPAPESRSRWACHPLLRSFTVRISVHFEPLSVPLQHTLFLGVDGDHWLLFGQSGGHLGVDVAELRIPVGVTVALCGLTVALQTVTRLIEQVADPGAADLVTLGLQRLRQPAHAFAGPPQRRFRVTPCRRLDQRLEIVKQRVVPRFREGRLLETVLLRPAPGRLMRSEGSSDDNSFRPRPMVLGATPVAIATAAIPP